MSHALTRIPSHTPDPYPYYHYSALAPILRSNAVVGISREPSRVEPDLAMWQK